MSPLTLIPLIEILSVGDQDVNDLKIEKRGLQPDCSQNTCYSHSFKSYNSVSFTETLSSGTLFRVWLYAMGPVNACTNYRYKFDFTS
jgi:hypothetical protein